MTLVATKEALDSLLSVQAAGTEVANRRILNFTNATVADTGTRADITVGGGASTGSSAAEPAGSAGQIYLPNDGTRLDVSDGTWHSFGPIFPLKRPPLAATWTTVNFGVGDSLTDTSAGLSLVAAPHASDWFRAAVRSVSSPYSVTLSVLALFTQASSSRVNICLRDSSSGKMIVFGPIFTASLSQLFVTQMTSATSFNAHKMTTQFGMFSPILFLRIADNGTTRTYQMSVDGVNFSQAYSEATGTFLTPNQVGFCVDVPTAGPYATTLISWDQ